MYLGRPLEDPAAIGAPHGTSRARKGVCFGEDMVSRIHWDSRRKYSVITWSRWTFAQLSHKV
jgi:hypothetical protein